MRIRAGDRDFGRVRKKCKLLEVSILKKLWQAVVCLLGCLAALPGIAGDMSKPAHFESGKEVEVVSARVGPQGAVLSTGNLGTPVDGIAVEIPAGALNHEVTVKLSYNTGKLSLNHGQPTGVFLRISAEQVTEFRVPIRIRVSYDPSHWKGYVLVGYAIDQKGRLSGVDSGPKDSQAGTASFSTLVPLLFTCVYAPL